MHLLDICVISLLTNLCWARRNSKLNVSSLKAEMRFKLLGLTVYTNFQDFASLNVANFKRIYNTEN